MVSGESKRVIENPWPSKRVMLRTALARFCWLGIVLVKDVIKVVLASLLRLGGTNRAPTTPPLRESESSTKTLGLTLEGKEMVATKGGLNERWTRKADELIDGKLLSRMIGVVDALGWEPALLCP